MNYPTFDLEQLNDLIKVIEQSVEQPVYLDPANCPYDEEIILKLRKLTNWLHPVARATEVDKNPVGRPTKKTVLPISDVEQEIDEIRKEITQLKIDAKGLDTKDRIDIIKARAALIEKVVGMKERITNIKQQQKFISVVMGIMEDIMEQSQRDEIIKRLQPFLEE